MRRAVNSIPANIAEGFGRYTFKDKANKYTIARGECLEVETFLHIITRIRIATANDVVKSRELTKRVGQLLSGLIRASRNQE